MVRRMVDDFDARVRILLGDLGMTNSLGVTSGAGPAIVSQTLLPHRRLRFSARAQQAATPAGWLRLRRVRTNQRGSACWSDRASST
jgi:hypothetical protein